MRFIVLILAMTVVAGCQQETDVTGSTSGKCIAELYSSFNPRNLNQCLTACSKCDHGTATTCSMSCKLKGAV